VSSSGAPCIWSLLDNLGLPKSPICGASRETPPAAGQKRPAAFSSVPGRGFFRRAGCPLTTQGKLNWKLLENNWKYGNIIHINLHTGGYPMRKLVIGLFIIAAVSLLFAGCGGGGGGGDPANSAIVHFRCVDMSGNPQAAGYTMHYTDPQGRARSVKVDSSSNFIVYADVAGVYTFTKANRNDHTVEIIDPKPRFSVTTADITNKKEFWYEIVDYLGGYGDIRPAN